MTGQRVEGEPAVRVRVQAADVQRFGLLSAAAVAARYAEVVDRTISGGGAPGPDDPHRPGDPHGPDDPHGPGVPNGMVDGTARLMQAGLRLLDAGAALVERTRQSVVPAPERLEPPPTAAGGWTQASLWVHNPTSTAAAVSLHATSLVAVTGAVLGAEAVECSPSDQVRVPPLGSCEVRVRVTVPAGQPAGHYHGLLVGSVAPEPMPLAVVVSPALGEDSR